MTQPMPYSESFMIEEQIFFSTFPYPIPLGFCKYLHLIFHGFWTIEFYLCIMTNLCFRSFSRSHVQFKNNSLLFHFFCQASQVFFIMAEEFKGLISLHQTCSNIILEFEYLHDLQFSPLWFLLSFDVIALDPYPSFWRAAYMTGRLLKRWLRLGPVIAQFTQFNWLFAE